MRLCERLSSRLQCWTAIGSSDYILNWIDKGVPIPFSSPPIGKRFVNNNFSQSDSSLLASEIDTLLQHGAIRRSLQPPTIVSLIFVVPK